MLRGTCLPVGAVVEQLLRAEAVACQVAVCDNRTGDGAGGQRDGDGAYDGRNLQRCNPQNSMWIPILDALRQQHRVCTTPTSSKTNKWSPCWDHKVQVVDSALQGRRVIDTASPHLMAELGAVRKEELGLVLAERRESRDQAADDARHAMQVVHAAPAEE